MMSLEPSLSNRPRPKIGVALSGGGMRGLAFLGVLQVLEETEIPVDIMAGASAGGLVAGLYAAGVPLNELTAFSVKTRITDFAFPGRQWHGFFGNARMAKLLATLLGDPDITFEDLRIPAAVTATDVQTGELVIIDRGPLIPALMATSAFPMLFAPVWYLERYLIDGGTSNDLPVDVLRQMGADRVLGLNVPFCTDLDLLEREASCWHCELNGRYPSQLFPWIRHILRWKLPLLTGIASVAATSRIINQTRLSIAPPDLLLDIELPDVGLLTSDNHMTIVQAGRQVAIQHKAQLIELKNRPWPPRWQRRLASATGRLGRAWEALRAPEHSLFPGGTVLSAGATATEQVE